jgi:hypothetical protein
MATIITMPPRICPVCLQGLGDAVASTSAREPKPQDLTVCMYCCHPLRFGENFSLQPVLLESLPPINQAQVLTAQEMIRNLWREIGGHPGHRN